MDNPAMAFNRLTGEIIPAKRVKSRLVPGKAFFDAMWKLEAEIDALSAASEAIYGTSDCNSPLWSIIENAMYEQADLALKYGFTSEEFKLIFQNPVNRIIRGLRPLEV